MSDERIGMGGEELLAVAGAVAIGVPIDGSVP